MSTRPKPYLTPEQYLEIDRAAERRSLSTTSQAVLRARGQRPAYSNQGPSARTLLLSGPRGVLRQASVGGRRKDTLTDAIVIIEVLSPSTERYDRTFKFEHYRTLASLKDYILIAQDQVKPEHKARLDDGSWERRETQELEDLIELPSIACAFRVADAYELVEFTETE